MKLRTQAGALLIVLAVVLSGVVFAGFQQNKATIEAEQTQNVRHASTDIADNLDQQLSANQRMVQLQATDPSVAAHGTTAQAKALEALVAESEFDGASVIARNGTMTAIEAGLNRTAREQLIGGDFSDREYFQRARSGETYIGEPLRADSGNRVVTISTPIRENGTMVGTLNAALHLRRGSTWRNVASTVDSHYGITVRTGPGETMYARAPDPNTELIEGTARVEATGWTVAVTGSRTLVAGDLRQVTLYQTGGVGLVVFLLGLVGAVAYTRMVRYHEGLLEGFSKIEREEYGYQIDIDADGEFRRLVDGFNRVSRDLEGYDSDIQAQQRELTASNAVLTSVLDNLPVGVLVEDADREITAANERLFEVLGVPGEPSDIVGRDCEALARELGSLFADPEWFQRRNSEIPERGAPVADEEIRLADGRTLARSYTSYDRGTGPGNLWLYRDITERKQRELRLERQDFLFDRAQDLANVGIWEYDPTAETLFWSDGVREIHGVDESYEPTIESALSFFPDSDRTEIETVLERSIENGEPFDAELQIFRADGERRDVRTRGETLEPEDSETVVARGTIQDVTEQKQRERELEQLSERLDLALKGGQLGVWDWNIETDAVEFDEQWAAMLGLSLEEVEPTIDAWERRAHPDDLPAAEAALEAHFTGETEYYECDHRMRTSGGDWIWVRDVGRVVERDDDGNPQRAVGIHQDITAEKEREQTLQAALEGIRELVRAETTADAATVAARLAAETLSFPCSAVYEAVDEDRLERAAATDTLPGAPSYRRDDQATPVGESLWTVYDTASVREVGDEDPLGSDTALGGGIVHPLGEHGVFVTATREPASFDEFERSLAELLATFLATTLGRIQREHHVESQRDDLSLLNQMVRHDIRNDLQVLLARVDLLTDHVDETGREYLETAERSVTSAIEITQTAHEMSEVMLQERKPAPMSLWDVVQRQVEALQSAEPGAEIRTPDPVPAVSVFADEMLESVVGNLLTNAVRHNDAETPVVELSVEKRADSVRLRVADNGPGVEPERQESIFGKGEKGLESDGTGIGLYLVHTLVTSYDGEVWVDDGEQDGDREGATTDLGGAVFVVELPKHE